MKTTSIIAVNMYVFLMLSALFINNKALASTTLANEFWICTNATENFYPNSPGTIGSPLDGSTAANFDTNLTSLPPNSTIHLMQGKFATQGADVIPAGSKLRGAGIDVTTVKMLDNFQGFASRSGGTDPVAIGQNYVVFWSDGDGAEVSDLTVDCNVQNQSYSVTVGTNTYTGISIGAVELVGSHVKLSRIKAINWGTTAANVECPILDLNPSPNGTTATNLLIEDCIVTHPAQITFSNGADAFVINGGAPDQVDIGTAGWVIGAEIRNCRCYNVGTGSFGNPNYFNGIGIGFGVDGGKVDGNMFMNVGGQMVMSSCGSLLNCTIDNNLFEDVANGIVFQGADACSITNSVKRNIRVSNNLFTVQSGGTAISLSGISSQAINGLDIEDNLVKAEDGSGAINGVSVSTANNVTIKNNTLDANGGSALGLGSSVQVALLDDNQNLAGATVAPPGWISTNSDSVLTGNGGTVTVDANLVVNGNVMESAGQAYVYNGVNMAYGITSLYDYFFGGSGNFTMTGNLNNGFGFNALAANTTGFHNAAFGYEALQYNTTGNFNVAYGNGALLNNTVGTYNVASGVGTLGLNTNGYYNSAYGDWALGNNTSGQANNAIGVWALGLNTTGFYNTADGYYCLYSNTVGSYNIGLGSGAGNNLTTGSYNIDIGNNGLSSDTGIIRIGSTNQTDTYLAGNVHAPSNMTISGTLSIGSGVSTTLSNSLSAVSVSISASPYFWTNTTARNLAVYINGLRGSVGYNGALLFGPITNAPVTVMMQPNEYLSITNTSGSPVLNWHPF